MRYRLDPMACVLMQMLIGFFKARHTEYNADSSVLSKYLILNTSLIQYITNRMQR